MKKVLNWLVNPPVSGPRSTLYLRVMAGGVFFWEGILKFVYANQGVDGCQAKSYLLSEECVEAILFAVEHAPRGMHIFNLGCDDSLRVMRIAEMIVAILSTKISLYLGRYPLPLLPVPPQVGIWAVLHEVRSEYAQLLTTAFLLINGPGRWSLDAILRKERPASLSERTKRNSVPSLSAV